MNLGQLECLKLLLGWTEKPIASLRVDFFVVCCSSLAGPQECWLLTANQLQVVTAQVKVCLNLQCLALHSFTDIYTGRKDVFVQHNYSLNPLEALGLYQGIVQAWKNLFPSPVY